MRAFIALTVLSVLIVGMGVAASGQALSVCRYEPPRNEAAELTVSGELHRFNDRFFDDRNNVNVGSLVLEGLAWSQDPEWSYNVRGSAKLRLTPGGVSLRSSLKNDAQIRRYLDELPFVFGGVNTQGVPFREAPTVSAVAGGGVGRFVNVTPMAQALKIARILKQQGVLEEEASAETIEQLAQLIGRRPELGLRGVLQEIENTVGKSFDVSIVLMLRDVLEEDMTRFCGWEANLGLGYELLDPGGPRDLILQAQASYAVAPDPDSRVVLRSSGQVPLPLRGTHQASASLQYNTLLSFGTDLGATYEFTHQKELEEGTTIAHALDVEVSTQVRPPVSLALKGHLGTGTEFEEPEWGFDLVLTYRVF